MLVHMPHTVLWPTGACLLVAWGLGATCMQTMRRLCHQAAEQLTSLLQAGATSPAAPVPGA